MRNLICAIALTLSLGCASAVVRPYIGDQQNWPTASGSIVNMRYDFPVFTTLPPSPYDVLGELRLESPFYAQPEEGHLPILIKRAKKMNADALVFVDGNIYFSTNYGPKPGADSSTGTRGAQPTLTQVNKFNPDSFGLGVTILAIRWIGEPPPGLPVAKKPAPAPVQEAAPAPKEEIAKPEEAKPAEEAPAEVKPAEAAPEMVTPPVAVPSEETNQPPAAVEEPAPSPPPAEQPAPPPAEQPAPPPAEQPAAPPAEQPPATEQ
jgi:hypothetical protein